jgi:hypothetical protein
MLLCGVRECVFKTNDPERKFKFRVNLPGILSGRENLKMFVLQFAEVADGLGAHTNTHKWLPASFSSAIYFILYEIHVNHWPWDLGPSSGKRNGGLPDPHRYRAATQDEWLHK